MAVFFPKEFEQKYSILLGAEASDFFECCKKKLPRTIRVNTLKTNSVELKQLLEKRGLILEKHSVFDDMFTVKNKGIHFSDVPEHRQGLFVSQDVSSTVPARVLSPAKNSFVLDMAAAPGTKTTQLAAIMQNSGAIVALDISEERLKGLRFNLNRIGAINTLVAKGDSRFFRSRQLFDFILLDAPCSSEGVIRKREDALQGWSQKLVESKSGLQKQLIANAFSLLKKGGALVYSTCTLAPEENEAVVDYLLQNNPNACVAKIVLEKFNSRNGLAGYGGKLFSKQIGNCLRVLPQDNDSEAFFVARIEKAMQ